MRLAICLFFFILLQLASSDLVFVIRELTNLIRERQYFPPPCNDALKRILFLFAPCARNGIRFSQAVVYIQLFLATSGGTCRHSPFWT